MLAFVGNNVYNTLVKKEDGYMANTSPVYARIDSNLKNDAEEILSTLGISPSSAIQMFYRQIVICNGLPFNLRAPAKEPVNMDKLSREEIDAELEKARKSVERGDVYTLEEVEEMLREKYGI